MRIFYVRPGKEGRYGAGDGSSYENAWNGFDAIDWSAVAACEPATVWLCGDPACGRSAGFLSVQVEWSYLAANAAKHALQSAANDRDNQAENHEARPHPRRESAQPV